MNSLVNAIEKMRPTFEKISNNPYLRAIRDGFISCIPVIIFSSIFLLVAYVPNIWGFYWSDSTTLIIMKAYNYSMGILGVLVSATVTKSLTDNFNGKLPATNQINSTSTMIASIISFLLVSADSIVTKTDSGISTAFAGTKGLLTAFLVAFIVTNIYKFCVKKNITIKLPDEVPGNISQTFKDLIPISLSIIFFWLFDFAFRQIASINFAAGVIKLFQPLFSAADGYVGLAIIFGAMSFFWFVGIHGPSIVEPAVSAIYLTNVAVNLSAFQNHDHAGKVLAQGTQYFVATLGGTGATLVITMMFAFLSKSKQLKAVGRASSIPVLFGVNEPVLFGAPLVLNPIFFIPFILTPILNVWLLRFFITTLGMNGFIYNLPWTTPGPIGLIMGTGFAVMSVVLMVVIIIVDFIVYYPFFKAYDDQLVMQEKEKGDISEKQLGGIVEQSKKLLNKNIEHKNVLVLCANGATSSMLANAIKKGAIELEADIEATAMAYGQHKTIIKDFDLIVLAPQMASMLEELQQDTDKFGVKAVSTGGAEYVSLGRNPRNAIAFVYEKLEER